MGLRSVRRSWESYGEDDPLWAILTSDENRQGKWDVDEFFATGPVDIDRALARLQELGVDRPEGAAVDFGCGVGRLTQALAARFESAHGVDIAAPMIEKANAFNRHGDRCRYHLNTTTDLKLFADDSMAFVLSLIVLLHNPPKAVAAYINEFGRILRPGGIGVIELREGTLTVAGGRIPIPAAARTAYLRARQVVTGKPGMEVHPVTRAKGTAMFRAAGLEVLAVDLVGIAATYYVRAA